MNNNSAKQRIGSSMVWALMERFGNQVISLVISIVLARILMPEDYGVLAIIAVFTNLANQLVQGGFNTSLIQRPDLQEEDYSSVFFVTLLIGSGLYMLIWLTAPIVSAFYEMAALTTLLRVQALLLFPNVLQSVQVARLRREMQFRKMFSLTLGASSTSGIVGICLAYMDLGAWALIGQQLTYSVASCIILWFYQKWTPTLCLNWKRLCGLLSYGWKILAGGMLSALYADLRTLIIGRRYSSVDLAYYGKGELLPGKIVSNFGHALQNVLLSALARDQRDLVIVKQVAQKTVQLSAFLIFPMLAGMAATAPALIEILLTEKWLESVPFMRLSCLILAMHPIMATNMQISKALGRSDFYLKIEIGRKVMGLIALISAVVLFDTPLAIMIAAAVVAPIEMLFTAVPGKKLVNYSVTEQIRDVAPPLLLSTCMCLTVSAMHSLVNNLYLLLILQVLTGVVIYAGGAALFKLKTYYYVLNILKSYIGSIGRSKRR